MRWFWQRRRDRNESAPDERQARHSATSAPMAAATVERAPSTTARLRQQQATREPRDALLRYALDSLVARGARVRVEEEDVVAATLADGQVVRYTTTLARARAEEETQFLVEGSGALTSLLETAAASARLTGLLLGASGAADALALAASVAPSGETCGRCAGLGGEPWLRGQPSCAACPLREGRLALRWAEPPIAASAERTWQAQAVELTYLLVHRDRRGRTDEWLRLVLDAATGRTLTSLTPEQLARAEAVALAPESIRHIGAAAERARTEVAPALEAAALFLRQRTEREYRRRVEEITGTHQRLRGESPEDRRLIDAALNRELAALGEVFGVEVDARLESVCLVTTPMVLVALRLPSGAMTECTVDLGRGTVAPPACSVCGEPCEAGIVCPQGHPRCGTCLTTCVACGRGHCATCDEPEYQQCALCDEAVCPECAHACTTCGKVYCPDHLWACGVGAHTVCLTCVQLCVRCERTLCAEHALRCSLCGDVLCAEHALACAECGTSLCAAHSRACATCGKLLCAEHASTCEHCGATTCASDAFDCLGCGQHLCTCAEPAPCATCQVRYCTRCLGAEEACPACRALAPAGAEALALLARAATQEPALAGKQTWQAGENARATVFVTREVGRQSVYVVSAEGTVLNSCRKGWRA